MKKIISALLAGVMVAAAGSMPTVMASENTLAAYFEDFESGSWGNIEAVSVSGNQTAELSVVDYPGADGMTSKVLKVKSNGYKGNPAFIYNPANASIGKNGLRISFDFYMDSDTYTNKVDNTGSAVPLIWSENKAVNSSGAYWFTTASTWKADSDNTHFAGSGNIYADCKKYCTGTWWKLVQDYDFANKTYSVTITDMAAGKTYGALSKPLSSIKAADDKFERMAIILPVKDSVTYIDNFTFQPLNRLDIDFGGTAKEVEMGEGSATVRAFDGWITAAAIDDAAQELEYAKNENAVIDLSQLSEGKHKLTTTVAYNNGTTEVSDTYFMVVNSKQLYVDEDFNDYSEQKVATDRNGYFYDNLSQLITNKVWQKSDNLQYVELHHKANGLMENMTGASGNEGDYAIKIGVTSTAGDGNSSNFDGLFIQPTEEVLKGQFVIEMDTMVSANTQVDFQGFVWDNNTVFTKDGGTLNNYGTAKYVPDQWKKLRIECDYENTADYCRNGSSVTSIDAYIGKVYYDNQYIGMIQLHPDDNRKLLRIKVNGDVGKYLAIDNLQIYKRTSKLYIDELDYTYENAVYTVQPIDTVIPAGASKLVIKANKAFDADVAVDIMRGSRAFPSTNTIENGNIVITPNAGTFSNGSYTVTIGSDMTLNISVMTTDKFTKADGAANAYVMSADGSGELALITAEYDEAGALTNAEISRIRLKKGLNRISAQLDGENSKAMLWESMETMKPYILYAK